MFLKLYVFWIVKTKRASKVFLRYLFCLCQFYKNIIYNKSFYERSLSTISPPYNQNISIDFPIIRKINKYQNISLDFSRHPIISACWCVKPVTSTHKSITKKSTSKIISHPMRIKYVVFRINKVTFT